MHHQLNSDGLPQYHLRRIGCRATLTQVADIMDFHERTTNIGRNQAVVDYFLGSANENCNIYISRHHAFVRRSAEDNFHSISDTSLTGIYINDVKVGGQAVLQEGDIVIFGHPQGKHLKPGTIAEQPNSEYCFRFEHCNCPASATPAPSLGQRNAITTPQKHLQQLTQQQSICHSPQKAADEKIVSWSSLQLPSSLSPKTSTPSKQLWSPLMTAAESLSSDSEEPGCSTSKTDLAEPGSSSYDTAQSLVSNTAALESDIDESLLSELEDAYSQEAILEDIEKMLQEPTTGSKQMISTCKPLETIFSLRDSNGKKDSTTCVSPSNRISKFVAHGVEISVKKCHEMGGPSPKVGRVNPFPKAEISGHKMGEKLMKVTDRDLIRENQSSSSSTDLISKSTAGENCWATTEKDVDLQLQKCRNVLENVTQILSAVKVIDTSHMWEWREQITELKKQTGSPKTYIAVVGDTGAGKSSLLNALLDEEELLPTSAMTACTASVVEVSYNSTDQKYEADVEFLTEEEWDKELKALFTDMEDTPKNLKKHHPDPQTEAGVAYSRVMAVYGKIAEFDELKQIKDITQNLGKVKHICKDEVSEFRNEIEQFMQSSTKLDESKGGEYWPIVKRVEIRVPNADVLKTGAVFVDLPGVRDSNAARNSVAKKRLMDCNAVWVVANITRAVDDETAKNLLNENLQKQLYMDGQYGRIAFICTKTDIYDCGEISRALKLKGELQSLKDEIAELKKQVQEMKKREKITGFQLWDKISDLTGQIADKQKKKDLICINARNAFSKQKIRQNFYYGLQEIKAKTVKEVDYTSSEEEDEKVPATAKQGAAETVTENDEQLQVFTVSARGYLQLQEKLEEGQPTVFSDIEDTEIPAVKRLAHQIALRQKVKTTEKVIRSVAAFISRVVTQLTNPKGQTDETHQAWVRNAVQNSLSWIRGCLQKVAEECAHDIMCCFARIEKELIKGVRYAVSTCEELVKGWGSTSTSPGKYPQKTYKAVCARQGVYTSKTYKHIDFNQALSDPLTTAITVTWGQVFSNDLIKCLERFKDNVKSKLKVFFKQKLSGMKLSTDEVNYIQKQHMEYAGAKLTNFILDEKDYITKRQRELNRILTPLIKKKMRPAYEACTQIKGTGAFERMQSCMIEHISEHKGTMFNNAAEKMREELNLLRNEICGHLQDILNVLCKNLEEQFEFLFRPAQSNKEIIPDLVNICERVRKICKDSHIHYDLSDPGELETTLPFPSKKANRPQQKEQLTGFLQKNRPQPGNFKIHHSSKIQDMTRVEENNSMLGRSAETGDLEPRKKKQKTQYQEREAKAKDSDDDDDDEDDDDERRCRGQLTITSFTRPYHEYKQSGTETQTQPRKKKKPRFTDAEDDIVISGVEENIAVFTEKCRKGHKNEVYESIARKINVLGCTQRTGTQVSKRWNDIQRRIRKKDSQGRASKQTLQAINREKKVILLMSLIGD